MKGRWRIVGLAIWVAGLAWIIAMAALGRGETFFSGDGGTKALLAKQFAHGLADVHLRLAGPQWATSLWRQGLFPFTPPFAYPDRIGYVVSFPFAFSALSAPFYWAFGGAGLLVVPALALIMVWGLFNRTLRVIGVSPAAACIAFFLFVFTAYLSIYGALFWEHTVGVLLAFPGLAYLATAENPRWTTARAFAAGLVCGLAFSIRPETLCLAGALGLICAASWLKDRRDTHPALVAGLAVGVGAILAMNWAVYGLPLGAHALQMNDLAGLHRVEDNASKAHIFTALIGNFLRYDPVCGFAILALALLPARRLSGPLERLLAALGLVLATVPVIVPNSGGLQHGPRYLLQIAPAIYLVAAILLAQTLALVGGWRKTALLTCLAICTLIGMTVNLVQVTARVQRDDRSRAETLRQIVADPAQVVAVDDTVIAQELEAAMPGHLFFLTDTTQKRAVLVKAALANGQSDILYVTPIQGAPQVDTTWPSAPGAPQVHFHCRETGYYQLCKARLTDARGDQTL